MMYIYIYICVTGFAKRGLSRRKWSPATTSPARPSMADLMVRPDHLWLPWMVRSAASGPP